VVTVVLTDLGAKTEMTFHQAGFTTEQGRANVQDGWSQSLDRLAGTEGGAAAQVPGEAPADGSGTGHAP